ncbi:MAG TPA: aldo/keto reductase [Gemmataceae bacterium]|nr:aldo/keto reductase [Gemmataceae bacterium]
MNQNLPLSRRDFIRAGTAGAAVLLGNTLPSWGDGTTAKLPQRALGKTGVQVPILGLGTVAVGNVADEKTALALIHRAIDLGVTYIDTAPARTRIALMTGYNKAQHYLKAILKERRKEVFIVTKCLETDGDKTIDLLKKNLDELGVEQVDLAYTHSIGHAVYDFDGLVADQGPMTALEKAKKEGLTRFVGITGHNRPEKFAQVIARRNIDAMMNACNCVDRHTYAFEEIVWPLAREKGIGIAAMKVFGGSIGITPCKMPEDLRHASFRFAQSIKGVALTVIGMGSIRELEQNVQWAKDFKPMTADEANELKEKTVALAKHWGAHLDRLDAKGEKERPLRNT